MACVTHYRIKLVDSDSNQEVWTLDLRDFNDLQTVEDYVEFAAAIRQAKDEEEAPITHPTRHQ